MGVASFCRTIIGHFIGTRDFEMVRHCVIRSVGFQAIVIVILAAAFAGLAGVSSKLFVSEEGLNRRLTHCFYFLSVHVSFNFFIASLASIFRWVVTRFLEMKKFIVVLHYIGHIVFLVVFNLVCMELKLQGIWGTLAAFFGSDFIISVTMIVVLICKFEKRVKHLQCKFSL